MQRHRVGRAPAKHRQSARVQRAGLLHPLGSRIFRRQIGQSLRALVGKRHKAHAFYRGRHQHLAKRRGRKRIINAQAGAAAFVFARRHPLDVHKQIMQAPTARKPRLPRRFLHTALLLQHLLGLFDADVLQHLFRAHPRPRLKLALQMRRAHMHLRRHRRQRRLLVRVVVKVFNGRRHAGKLDLFAVHHAAPAVYLKPC